MQTIKRKSILRVADGYGFHPISKFGKRSIPELTGCMLVVMGRLEDIPADYEGRLGVPVFLKNLSNKNDLTEPPMPCAWR